MRRYLAYRPLEAPPGHGQSTSFLLPKLGLLGIGEQQGWIRAALPPLGMLAGPIQHFQSATYEAWQLEVGAQLADRKGFLGCPVPGYPRIAATTYLFSRDRDKMLLRFILCGGVWNGSFLVWNKGRGCQVPLLWRPGIGMGICFGTCTFLPVLHVREIPSSRPSLNVIEANEPVVCCGMVGLLV